MRASQADGVCAIEAYESACGTRPLLAMQGRPETGLSLYHWGLKPTRQAEVPCTREVTLMLHLGGARRVRVFTESGLSRRFSRPGDITLIPRGQSIRYLVDGGADFATMHLPETAAKILDDQDGIDLLGLSECLFAFRDEYALAGIRALMKVPASDGSVSRYSAQILESLALHVARIVRSGDAERIRLAQTHITDPRTDRGIDFEAVAAAIEVRIGESISIGDLADLAGSCRSIFCEQFKDHFGLTPHRYLLDRRVEKAKVLLGTDKKTLTDLAYELGFSSAAHFSTAFKNSTGLSPSAFLQAAARQNNCVAPQRIQRN